MATKTPVYMTGEEYKRTLEKLGLTHSSKATARFLDLDLSTSHRYTTGFRSIPKQTAMLLRLMVRKGLRPEDVEGLV